MGKINVLSFEVANLIAAGEVVDRPASVIKELLENAIDSGATRISVEIQRGGVAFMRVSDNGCGMTAEDLPVAVRRHATSKIRDASDLEAIMTLGFRGEALAAICSVSDVRIVSKTEGAELGSYMEVHRGTPSPVSERGASRGTTVIVENLFANVPARLKFLKRDQTEAMAVGTTVEKVALSHPEIAMTFINDGNMKLETSGNGDLLATIRAVFGRQFAERMLKVEAEHEGVRISGYITTPDSVRSNRNYENFFVNNRYIKTRTGSAAIEQAFASYIAPEKFPGCVLKLDVNPGAVDINVHPAKLEVKFSSEKSVFDAVYYSVRAVLSENTKRPIFDAGDSNDAPFMRMSAKQYAKGFAPARVSDANVPIRDKTLDGGRKDSEQSIFDRSPMPEMRPAPQVTEVKRTEASAEPAPRIHIPERKPEEYRFTDGYARATEDRASSPEYARRVDAPVIGFEPMPKPIPEEEPPKEPEAAENASLTEGIDYRIVGEVFNTYIIVERGDSCLLIDKHAAHERLNFENMKRMMYAEGERTSRMLIFPVDVMLMSDEVALLEEYRGEIERVGFDFSTSRNTVSVNAIPDGVETDEVGPMLEGFADVLKNATGNVGLTRDLIFEKALYQASCKASIKGGREYPDEYKRLLVAEMMRMPDITYCPHGRPVAMELTKSAIDKKFKRI